MEDNNKPNNDVYPTKLELSSMICGGGPCKARTKRGTFAGPERVYLKIEVLNDELFKEEVADAVRIVCQKALEYFC